jgi:hypothetical protein
MIKPAWWPKVRHVELKGNASFRRLWMMNDQVCIETTLGIEWVLPGKYNGELMFDKIKKAGEVDLSRWRRLGR